MLSFKSLLSLVLMVLSFPMASFAGQELSGTFQVTRVLSIQDDAHAGCVEHLPAWGCKVWYRSSFAFLNQDGKETAVRVRSCLDRGLGAFFQGRYQLSLELSTGSDNNKFIGSQDGAVTYSLPAGSREECLANEARLLSTTSEKPLEINFQTQAEIRSFQLGN